MRKAALGIALCLFLAGCWDRREIEERANVLAMSVDACKPTEPCQVRVTRQIAIPGRIPLGATPEASSNPGVKTVALFTSEGADGPEARIRSQARLNRQINPAHLRVLLFGDAYARQGLAPYLDMVRRDPQTRRLMWLAIVEGSADDVLRARPSLERVPAIFLSDMFDDAVKTGRLPQSFLGEFLTQLANRGEEPVAPVLKMAGPNRYGLAGLAVFRGDRMVGKLSPEETATYLQLRGLRRGSELIRLTLPEGNEADLTVVGRRTRYQVRAAGRQIQVRLSLQLECDLLQATGGLNLQDHKTLDRIEDAAARQVKSQGEALVRKLQTEFQADVLAVGERVRAYLPRVWESIPDWSAAFADARFEIEVEVAARRTGLSAE